MFPETLELMLRDLCYLGLISFEIIEISQTEGIEFFIHLRKPLAEPPVIDAAEHMKIRQALVERITSNIGSTVFRSQRLQLLPNRLPLHAKRLLKTVLGQERYVSLREMNRKRRAKSKP
jgi:hypothetical protein